MNSKTAIVFTGDIGFDRHMDKNGRMSNSFPKGYCTSSTAQTEKNWIRYRKSEEYCEGAHMDYDFLRPIAEKAENNTWQQSTLEKVKDYLLYLL